MPGASRVGQRSRLALANQDTVCFVELQGVPQTEAADHVVEFVETPRVDDTVQQNVWVLDRVDLQLTPVGLDLIAPPGGRPRTPSRPHEVLGHLGGITAAETNPAYVVADLHPLKIELSAVVRYVHAGSMKPQATCDQSSLHSGPPTRQRAMSAVRSRAVRVVGQLFRGARGGTWPLAWRRRATLSTCSTTRPARPSVALRMAPVPTPRAPGTRARSAVSRPPSDRARSLFKPCVTPELWLPSRRM